MASLMSLVTLSIKARIKAIRLCSGFFDVISKDQNLFNAVTRLSLFPNINGNLLFGSLA